MNLPDRAFGAGAFYPQRKVHADLSEGAPDGEGHIGLAMEKYPVVLALFEADMEAAKILEKEN